MAHTTIEQFATELKLPPGALLEQLAKAGVAGKNEGDGLSEQDKTKLLEYLQKQHGAAGEPKKKITLTQEADHRDQGGRFHRQGAHDPGRSAQEARLHQARRDRGGARGRGTGQAGRRASDQRRGARGARGGGEEGAGADRPPAGRGAEEAGAGGQAQDEEGARSRGGRGQGRGGRRRGGCGQGAPRPPRRRQAPAAKRYRGHAAPSGGQAGRAFEAGQEERRGIPGRGRAAARAQAARRRHGRHRGRWLAAAEGRRPAPRRRRRRRRRARGGELRSSAT